MQITNAPGQYYVIPGDYTPGTMPDVSTSKGMFAWDTTLGCYMESDGVTWKPTTSLKTISTYNGTTDASGNYAVVFDTTKSIVPHVNPSLYPTNNAAMVCRLTAASVNGFTVKVEQRTSLNVLGIDLLSFAVTNVNNQPVRVLVVD